LVIGLAVKVGDAAFAFGFGPDQALEQFADAAFKSFVVGETFGDIIGSVTPEDVPAAGFGGYFCHMRTIHMVVMERQDWCCFHVRGVYDLPLMRRRNISWDEKTDALAVQLAGEAGLSQSAGGVSKLLEMLILAEADPNRPSHLQTQASEVREELAKLKQAIAKNSSRSEHHDWPPMLRCPRVPAGGCQLGRIAERTVQMLYIQLRHILTIQSGWWMKICNEWVWLL
jgi:hypothetical protein